MEDKRMSLRFRMDNDSDRKAWETLEAMVDKKNISKNAIVIELILSSASSTSMTKKEQEIFADMVSDRVIQKLGNVQMLENVPNKTPIHIDTESENETKAALKADEPALLGEDALDFLSMF